MNRVMLVVVSVIQVGLASGSGWARLTPTVRPPRATAKQTSGGFKAICRFQ